MTLSEQELLVFDYLSGSLSPAAEQDFYIQLALDSELQQTLKAMQIVERAISKDRKAATVVHTQSREHVLGLLGMSQAAPYAGTAVGGATVGSATVGGAIAAPTASSIKWGLAALSASSIRWTLAAVAVSSLAIGTFVLAPILQRNSSARTTEVTPASQPRTSEVYQEAPSSRVVPNAPTPQRVRPVTRAATAVIKPVEADTTTQPPTPVLSVTAPRVRLSEKDTIKLRVKIEPGSK